MVTFRSEHLQAFERLSREQFMVNYAAHARKDFPKETAAQSDDELRAMVRTGVDRASRYNVILENDVVRYLDGMLVWGSRFDAAPETHWAGQILRTRTLTGTQKMDSIDKFAKRAQEKAVSKRK